MYQKQEIVINRSSEEAMKFLMESVLPYIRLVSGYISEEPNAVTYFDSNDCSKPVMSVLDHYVNINKHIVSTADKITIVLEEEWDKVFDTCDMMIPCNELPEDAESCGDLREDDTEEYLKEKYKDLCFISSSCSDTAEEESASEELGLPNYRDIEKDYISNRDKLKDVCSVKIVRGFDPTDQDGAFVEVWDSNDCDTVIRANDDCGRSFFITNFHHLNIGREVAAEELPEKQWLGVEPYISLRRLNGFKESLDDCENMREPYSMAEPLSEELAARFKDMPQYVHDAENALNCDFHIGICDNELFCEDDTGLWCDTIEIWDKIEEVSTSKLTRYISELGKLCGNIQSNNDSVCECIGMNCEPGIEVFMLFYTKEFDLLEVVYSNKEHKMKFFLYENGSEKNALIGKADLSDCPGYCNCVFIGKMS